jgi:hypothetical protein
MDSHRIFESANDVLVRSRSVRLNQTIQMQPTYKPYESVTYVDDVISICKKTQNDLLQLNLLNPNH